MHWLHKTIFKSDLLGRSLACSPGRTPWCAYARKTIHGDWRRSRNQLRERVIGVAVGAFGGFALAWAAFRGLGAEASGAFSVARRNIVVELLVVAVDLRLLVVVGQKHEDRGFLHVGKVELGGVVGLLGLVEELVESGSPVHRVRGVVGG